MLLAFKPLRDLDKLIGRALGKFYNWVAPNKTSRKSANYSSDEAESLNAEFKERHPKVLKAIEGVCKELGEEVPVVHNSGLYMMDRHNNLHVPVYRAGRVPEDTFKQVIAHEIAHYDTNSVGYQIGKFTSKMAPYEAILLALSFTSLGAGLSGSFFGWSLLTTYITNAYSRSEEFRCDEKSIKLGVKADISEFLEVEGAAMRVIHVMDSDDDGKSTFRDLIYAFKELFVSHPSSWARKLNFEEEWNKYQKENGSNEPSKA